MTEGSAVGNCPTYSSCRAIRDLTTPLKASCPEEIQSTYWKALKMKGGIRLKPAGKECDHNSSTTMIMVIELRA